MSNTTDFSSLLVTIDNYLIFRAWRNSEFEKINNQLEDGLQILEQSIIEFVNNQSHWVYIIGMEKTSFHIDVLNPWIIKQVENCVVGAMSSFRELLSGISKNSHPGRCLENLSNVPLRNGLENVNFEEVPDDLSFSSITATTLAKYNDLIKKLPLGNLALRNITGNSGYRKLENELRIQILGESQKPETDCILNTLQAAIVISAENMIKDKIIEQTSL